MVSVFFITSACVCLHVFVCAAMCSLFLQSVSAWVLWDKASAAEALSPYITLQTRPVTVEQLAVSVSHQQCCPSGTILVSAL